MNACWRRQQLLGNDLPPKSTGHKRRRHCSQARRQCSPLELGPIEQTLRQAAVFNLELIGIAGNPPDPATQFEELGGDLLNEAWLSGAVHPITFRGIAGRMLTVLPKPVLQYLGGVLYEAGKEDEKEERPKIIEAFELLKNASFEALDKYFSEPIVSINPAASDRQVSEAIGSLLKQWKEERGLSQTRDRSDKFDEYLQVWDLREGWNAGRYDRGRELRLKEVAEQLGDTFKTVLNRYLAAFELITGHEYSRELWYVLMGSVKLTELSSQGIARVSRRRPLASPSASAVPETVIQGNVTDSKNQGMSSHVVASNDTFTRTWRRC